MQFHEPPDPQYIFESPVFEANQRIGSIRDVIVSANGPVQGFVVNTDQGDFLLDVQHVLFEPQSRDGQMYIQAQLRGALESIGITAPQTGSPRYLDEIREALFPNLDGIMMAQRPPGTRTAPLPLPPLPPGRALEGHAGDD